MGRLDEVDLFQDLSKQEAQEALKREGERLAQLRLTLGGLIGGGTGGPPLVVVFEGWDAPGRGGAIKRLVAPLAPRHVRVAQFAAPTADEKRHHFLGRFWPALPGWGGMTVFDRSWYGRGVGGGVEGFATKHQWERAYAGIVGFERAPLPEKKNPATIWVDVSPGGPLGPFPR